jgi:hypothetical protein
MRLLIVHLGISTLMEVALMASKIKVDQLETADGSGTIALQNQLSGLTSASMPTGSVLQVVHKFILIHKYNKHLM